MSMNNYNNQSFDYDRSLNLSQSFNDSIFKDKINPNSSLFKSLSKSNNQSNSLISSNISEFINFYKKNSDLLVIEREISNFLDGQSRDTQENSTREGLMDSMNISIGFLSDAFSSIKVQREYIQKLEEKIKLDTKLTSDSNQQSKDLIKAEEELQELKIKYNKLEADRQILLDKLDEDKVILENNEKENQRKIANKNIEIEELIKKIKFLSNSEIELGKKLNESEKKFSDLERNTQLKIRAIEKEKMQFRTEVNELKHKSPTHPNNENKAKDSEIKHLKTINRQLDEQIQQQKKTLESTLKILTEKESQLDQLTINSISNRSPISKSNSTTGTTMTPNEIYEQKLKDCEIIIQSLKSEIQYYKQQNQDSVGEIERLKTLSDNLGNLELIKQQNDSYKDKLSRLEPIIEKYNSLQIEYSNLLQDISNNENNSENNNQIEQLKQKIIKLENDNQLLISKIGDLTANWKLVENRNKDINENIESEKESIENKEKRISELTEKIKRVEKLNYLLKRERDNFKNILDAYDEEDPNSMNVDSTRDSLKNDRIKELERALKEKTLWIEEFESQFDLGNGIGKGTSTEKANNEKISQQQYKDEISKLNKEIEGLLEENAMLESRLGKGEYDPTKTKVLHFVNNPTTAILNPKIDVSNGMEGDKKILEENHRLQIQINDSEKKLDRLKLIFRQKINEFREGVYALLGYKIEVDTNGLYKLQSMYAESENDFLIFKNNTSGSNKTIQMELLETDFTRNLDKEIKAYLFTCKSIPSFLSQVTIDLFSRQTFHP
ncbi:hypothetical protein DICPUDRAFT_152585 [Dictyostelium purpureum]|uniref:Spindle assembly checkpoint component MAD1 n=1 Tax=Dictyostelium purpureum TaxID=5786 RepID=F0ZLR9_DICPU|nr:uncharacterized protein DICPUDRAFT_152585 [Dictyostelium purpureum]EGC35119.1 hypothetical protein DICPUDRAFT_152585 [Dictyostelium purpureum]|eukprot:XP_003288371.1 hypothetical protein DICPUDRAFT_152585 [Dictyostelium purpureum]